MSDFGFSNAGKSTFYQSVFLPATQSADYPFNYTASKPWRCDMKECAQFCYLPISCLVEGAAEATGLGLSFLNI